MGRKYLIFSSYVFGFISIASSDALTSLSSSSRSVVRSYRRSHRCIEATALTPKAFSHTYYQRERYYNEYSYVTAVRATESFDIISQQSDDELHPKTKVGSRYPTDEWLHQYLSLSMLQQKQLYVRWPNGIDCVRRLGTCRLHAWLDFFLSDEVGLNTDQLRTMIMMRPQLLSYTLSNVQATTLYFRGELGLSANEYASLLQSYPSVLMYSIDNRLRPTVDFLQNDCGGGKDNWSSWKRVVYSYPNVFSHSLEKTLLPKVKFLCNRDYKKSLGLKRSELSQLVAKFPPILWLSEDNLQSKLDFLSESIGLEWSELKTIIVSYPQMLGLSVHNNLQPKVDFFLDGPSKSTNDQPTIHCGLSKDQLKEFVMYQPALLAYSLENRLRPRISRMQEKNIYL